MSSVLFVCTANRFLSPLAASWFQRCLEQDADAQNWSVGSAGTWTDPGRTVIPSAKWIADHFGINLESHKSIRINRELLAQYDLILVMENSHQEALLIEFPELNGRVCLLTKAAGGIAYDIPDPGIFQDETYLDVAKEVISLIEKGFQRICLMARHANIQEE